MTSQRLFLGPFTLPRFMRDDASDEILWLRWPDVMDPGPLAMLVDRIMGAHFFLDGQRLAIVRYLRMMAERENTNDIWAELDTNIRDVLYEPCVAYVRAYFAVLGDCMTPAVGEEEDPLYWWAQYAACLFWRGRTGPGLVRRFAGMEEGGFAQYQAEMFRLLDPDRELERRIAEGSDD